MELFQKMGNAVTRLMYGRNGMDQLNQALVCLYAGLWLAEMLCGSVLHLGLLAWTINTANVALLVWILFRTFSKNLPKRRAENQRWTGWLRVAKGRQAGARARYADQDHRYFTCKDCGAVCRVPAGKGRIIITCPRCGAEIQAKT